MNDNLPAINEAANSDPSGAVAKIVPNSDWRPRLMGDLEQGEAVSSVQARRVRRMLRFLANLQSCLVICKAAEQAGVGERLVYAWRRRYPSFAECWDEVMEDAVNAVEGVAMHRAIHGSIRQTFDRDGIVRSQNVEHDTKLQLALLAARKPKVYSPKVTHEHDERITVTYHIGLAREPQKVLGETIDPAEVTVEDAT